MATCAHTTRVARTETNTCVTLNEYTSGKLFCPQCNASVKVLTKNGKRFTHLRTATECTYYNNSVLPEPLQQTQAPEMIKTLQQTPAPEMTKTLPQIPTPCSFRLFDFQICNEAEDEGSLKQFVIKMYGIDENGNSAAIFVYDYLPFFYVKVPDSWDDSDDTLGFLKWLRDRTRLGTNILKANVIKAQKLYGFDDGKLHKYIQIHFLNTEAFDRAKWIWYEGTGENRRLATCNGEIGVTYSLRGKNLALPLYEGTIPPLLRFLHITEISPSGWVSLDASPRTSNLSTCKYEFSVSKKDLKLLNDKETVVPYKILSLDIEADSSHGDFPIPVKSYAKLANEIMVLRQLSPECISPDGLKQMVLCAFNYAHIDGISHVYAKRHPPLDLCEILIDKWLNTHIKTYENEHTAYDIEQYMTKMNSMLETTKKNEDEDESDDEDDTLMEDRGNNEIGDYHFGEMWNATPEIKKNSTQGTILDLLKSTTCDRDTITKELTRSLDVIFPKLQGDRVTHIGLTYMRYGEAKPYIQYCITLGECAPVEGVIIKSCETEADVLLAFRDLVLQEDHDIEIGYNTFGFDWEFMFRRAQELGITEEFLQLSRIKDKICLEPKRRAGDPDSIGKSQITLASGTYDLSIVFTEGRLQVDMYNWLRRTTVLDSYKLDSVGTKYIGDDIFEYENPNGGLKYDKKNKVWCEFVDSDVKTGMTRIGTKNMMGLTVGNYVHIELINHSTDLYCNPETKQDKFQVVAIGDKWFEIDSIESPKAKQIRWGLAKDDVTPKQLFALVKSGPEGNAKVAKYCVQDCNLVQYLFKKIDTLTELIEMSSLCSVPMSFLVFRGQGIKLVSYIAKKCREKGVLVPVINKGPWSDAYEGAIVLEPKIGIYLDKPIPVGDYSSLYPSSILSENLCMSSKVWTKYYDLHDNFVKMEMDSKFYDKEVESPYDNLPETEYVNTKFQILQNVRSGRGNKIDRIPVGKKICRFKQPRHAQDLAVIPAILDEVIKARNAVKKQKAQATDPFMKNVLEQRQLARKLVANSTYGLTGAKTSSIYEIDVGASTTATGRKNLTYAKRVITECYHDKNVDILFEGTTYHVHVNAEYIYGDTDSVFFTFNITNPTSGEHIGGRLGLGLSIELGKIACKLVSKFLKQPHEFTYEKTMQNLELISKKRYAGMLFEDNPDEWKRKDMGLATKRRGYAPIVKDVYGGVVDLFLIGVSTAEDESLKESPNIKSIKNPPRNDRSNAQRCGGSDRNIAEVSKLTAPQKVIANAVHFVEEHLHELVNGRVSLNKLVLSSAYNPPYAKPESVGHWVLAQRIAKRDAGNKPSSGDRIAYAFVVHPDPKAKKGDRIETPAYIKEQNLQLDYAYYITNQIMENVLQLFALVLEDLFVVRGKSPNRYLEQAAALHEKFGQDDNFPKKLEKLRKSHVKEMIMDSFLRIAKNKRDNVKPLTEYFTTTVTAKNDEHGSSKTKKKSPVNRSSGLKKNKSEISL